MTSYYDDCIVFLLAKAYQAAHGLFKKKLVPYGLTPVQNLILEVLWEQEGLTIGEINKKVSVDYATLSTMLERMVNLGWVRKERNPKDKRSWHIYLSDKAQAMKEKLLAAQEETNQHMAAKLSEPERLLLFRILKDLREIETPESDELTDG